MQSLIIYSSTAILAWLAGEPIESVPDHIAGGYPGLLDGWQAGSILAAVITVPAEDQFRPDLYEIHDGAPRKIPTL